MPSSVILHCGCRQSAPQAGLDGRLMNAHKPSRKPHIPKGNDYFENKVLLLKNLPLVSKTVFWRERFRHTCNEDVRVLETPRRQE